MLIAEDSFNHSPRTLQMEDAIFERYKAAYMPANNGQPESVDTSKKRKNEDEARLPSLSIICHS